MLTERQQLSARRTRQNEGDGVVVIVLRGQEKTTKEMSLEAMQ